MFKINGGKVYVKATFYDECSYYIELKYVYTIVVVSIVYRFIRYCYLYYYIVYCVYVIVAFIMLMTHNRLCPLGTSVYVCW